MDTEKIIGLKAKYIKPEMYVIKINGRDVIASSRNDDADIERI